ncbi:GNAT family N-acetyltransferase [Vagococcus zengguangii]|uniref:GNAT family N-acetyltransferase n=2 Tax=Vagococcus zengguangii TaxID=2571750 RepID=A0A4D7CZJ2_9ENTE|nr:GNAT family N-acetyltransferase [Vagococcus zengguangii]
MKMAIITNYSTPNLLKRSNIMTTLTYQKISLADEAFLTKLLTNPNLMMLGWGKTFTKNDIDLWITKILAGYQQDDFSYYLVINNQQPIGIAGLLKTTINQREVVEIAYIIDEPFQRQGLATQIVAELLTAAFNVYGLEEVVIQFNEEHHASRRIAEKNGALPLMTYKRKQGTNLVNYDVYFVKKR